MTALTSQSTHTSGELSALELVVSRLAVSMLRWSEAGANRRRASCERSVLAHRMRSARSEAGDYAVIVRHMRLG